MTGKRFALLGADVTHSHSKLIHESILSAFGFSARYDLLSVSASDLPRAIKELKSNYDGFNVTMPYKEAVLSYLSDCTPEVTRLSACNTVRVAGGKLYGYNTDGAGLLRSLEGFVAVQGKKVLLLGAGGASSASAFALASAGAKLWIYNRTAEKAEKLANKLNISAIACDRMMCFSEKYDIIVNTTSVGNFNSREEVPIALASLARLPEAVVDIIYYPRQTALLRDAAKRGVKTLNGFPMLYYQALEADHIFLNFERDERREREILKQVSEKVDQI